MAIGNIVSDFVAAPVTRIPAWGELYSVTQPINLNIGGNAAIFSACASRLGLQAGLMGKIGDDEIGQVLLKKLKDASVDVSFVSLSRKKPTAATLVIANESGERSFYHHIGANAEFGLADVDFSRLFEAKALLLCSYFIMPSLAGDPTKTILKKAKENNMVTFFDVAWDPTGNWDLDEILNYVDVFIPNEDEITRIMKKKDVADAIHELLDAGVKTVAVKLGSKGCYIENYEGEKIQLKAHNVKALDTTGAGDTFNAGFVYGILSMWDLDKTARFANAAAAISVTKLGGATAAPTLNEVEKFIKNKIE